MCKAFISFGFGFFFHSLWCPRVSIYLGYGLVWIHFDLFDQTNFYRMLIKVLICTLLTCMNSEQSTDEHIEGPVWLGQKLFRITIIKYVKKTKILRQRKWRVGFINKSKVRRIIQKSHRNRDKTLDFQRCHEFSGGKKAKIFSLKANREVDIPNWRLAPVQAF